jgi:hypothetical protein
MTRVLAKEWLGEVAYPGREPIGVRYTAPYETAFDVVDAEMRERLSTSLPDGYEFTLFNIYKAGYARPAAVRQE